MKYLRAEMISFVKRLSHTSACTAMEFMANTGVNNTSGMRRCVMPNRYISTGQNAQQALGSGSKSRRNVTGFHHLDIKKKLITSSSMSTLQNQPLDTSDGSSVSQDESMAFRNTFTDILRDLDEIMRDNNSKETVEWFTRVLEYNVPHGKQNRGTLAVLSYKSIAKREELSPENIRLARVLGWCVELLQAYFLVNDDVMDHSITRRGRPCWYKLEDVGLTAVNDSIFLETSIFALLRKYFRNKDCYVDLMELFHETKLITACGQNLDLLNAGKPITDFTIDKYLAIVERKTSHYTFYLPFAAAMHLAGIKDPEAFRQCKAIFYEIGRFFQIQDDFIDCFGNPDVTGKIGTDIQDNKCSWLAVMCMQRANHQQKQIMQECYGKNDPEKVQKIKDLYKTLDLPNIYAIYEEESYNMIKQHVQQLAYGVPHDIFYNVLNKLYKREV